MENLIEAIRNAVADHASDEARATGAQACRTILTALEAKPGDPLVMPSSQPSEANEPAAQFAQMLGALREIPSRKVFGIRNDELPLIPAAVDTWGPLVFVNLDLDAEPLSEFLEGIPEDTAMDLTGAARAALLAMIDWLEGEHGLTRPAAYCLCSACVDLHLSQVVDVPYPLVSALIPLDVFMQAG